MELKEIPLFSHDGLSVSTLQLVDNSLLNENFFVFKRQQPGVTAEQRLPDGVRDSEATFMLLKVIYDSQPNKDDFISALAYRSLHKQNQALTDKEVQVFVVSVQTPSQETREKFGYRNMRYSGVYESQESLLTGVPLISLNELSDEPYNAVFKCFASQTEVRKKAYEIFEKQSYSKSISVPLKLFLKELSQVEGEYTRFSPEQFMKGEN